MGDILFVDRRTGEFYRRNNSSPRRNYFDVSSYADEPFNRLSPFTYSLDFQIPVPGMECTHAHSVESIWQGLKVINGKTQPTRFKKRPKKRRGEVEGHRYKERILGVQEARENIYIPAYTSFLDNFAPKEAIDHLLSEQRLGKTVHLYDVEDNGDLQDPAPLAHASVLATYLNLKIFNQTCDAITENEELLFRILEQDTSIEDKTGQVEGLIQLSGMRDAVRYHCVEHPQGDVEYSIGTLLAERLEDD
ncbi:DUF6939 family protein [Nanoarchaeota archaeon]